MEEQTQLVPVLQLDDLESLKAAQEHLEKQGYQTKVGPVTKLPETEWQDWMTPDNGGYLLYLEKVKYKPAMELLGEFFGYTE